MKTKKIFFTLALLLILVSGITIVFAVTFIGSRKDRFATRIPNQDPAAAPTVMAEHHHVDSSKGCVFKTVFGEEPIDSNFVYPTPVKVVSSIDEALQWMAQAQLPDGGWGSGTHAHQEVMNPHEVKSDPASTAMVSMALLRCNNTPTSGKYSSNLNRAINYLLITVENASDRDERITSQTGTQPQIKLGSNIDVILSSQFFTNLLDVINNNPELKARVEKCNNKCVRKIQMVVQADGSFSGSGWAGVLQSAFATNALETAKEKGANVDTTVLDNAKNFQKGNYDAKSGDVKTDMGAGVMLYSISGSSRASAKEAKVAKERVEQAKKEGKLSQEDKVNSENLEKIGFSSSDATKYATAYDINEASKFRAQQSDVMDGFGSNGGEEFLSYLQTGEGMIVSKDVSWKQWYDNISGRLMGIQNQDGSWNGHHCITSPVFCTATCLLILSVNNDIEQLMRL